MINDWIIGLLTTGGIGCVGLAIKMSSEMAQIKERVQSLEQNQAKMQKAIDEELKELAHKVDQMSENQNKMFGTLNTIENFLLKKR